MKTPICLSAPVTHSDWMLRPDVPWGPAGVRYMLDQCKACGWSRIYWRTFDGGRALYASKLMDPLTGKWDIDNYWNPQNPDDIPHAYWMSDPRCDREAIVAGLARLDYSGFDTLAAAVRYGHQIGLEVHAWLTINEDDHAWGLTSRFTRENPQTRWRKRDGMYYRSQQSFAYESVQRYKLALVREIVEGYDIDGIFLDWMRTGDVRDNPQSDAQGVADFGYETPLVESFERAHGIDPHSLPNGDGRWVAWRAEPQTRFMRSVRQMMKASKPQLPLAVMGQHPWSYRGNGDKIDGNLRGLLLDVETWADEGLIDAAVAAGYYRDGGNAELAHRWLGEQTQERIDIWTFAWVPETTAGFDQDLALARKLSAPQILFWEADYIDLRTNRRELQDHMKAHLFATLNAPAIPPLRTVRQH